MAEIIIHRPHSRARVIFLSIWSILVVVVLLWAREILLPFILALVLAYVLLPAVVWVEKRKMPRWSAVIVVYVLTIGGLYISMAAMAPRLGAEMRGLFRELPAIAATIRDEHVPALRHWLSGLTGVAPPPSLEAPPPPVGPMRIVPQPDGSFEVNLGPGVEVHQLSEGRWRLEPVPSAQVAPFEPGKFMSDAVSKSITYVQRNTMEVIRLGRSIITVVSRAIFIFFMTLMLGAYLMITEARIFAFFRSLVFPDERRSFDLLVARIDRGLAGVVRGQLLICLVNGVLSAIAFWFFDLTILSSIPIVAIALTQSFRVALEVLGSIVMIHQLEANFLNPKIIGGQAHIHPVLVIFSLLVGEHFFGLPGALLAVPVLSIAQSIFLHFRYITFGDDAPADSFLPPPPASHSVPPPPPPLPEV